MIAVIDYGVANLASIMNMLRKIGATAQIASSPADLEVAKAIILPGIGAFDHGAEALAKSGFDQALRKKVLDERLPILGICLGMQLLGRSSEEGGGEGLAFLAARCVKFKIAPESALKVPHMGWNQLKPRRESELVGELEPRSRFYFVHSYHMQCDDPDDVIATARHGVDFAAVVGRDNIHGAQFHPEKSHRYGMQLLTNFARISQC